MAPEPKLVDMAGAALILGTTHRHIKDLLYQRKIPYVKIGRKVRFELRDLDRYIKVNRVEAER